MLVTLFFLCALFGGTIMMFQFLLMMFGFGDFGDAELPDVDVSGAEDGVHVHGSHGAFRVVSFRTLVSGLTFFGLGGLAGYFGTDYFGIDAKYRAAISIPCAMLLGLSALLIVYYIYSKMYSLRYDGSVKMETLLGAKGTVYVKIHPHKATGGKVLVNHQERTMEYEAITAGEEIKSGTPVTVIRIVSENMVEVETL
ncbi:MAG: hypothetical protein ACRC2T_14405 [Thermoguttaceae bacterium]